MDEAFHWSGFFINSVKRSSRSNHWWIWGVKAWRRSKKPHGRRQNHVSQQRKRHICMRMSSLIVYFKLYIILMIFSFQTRRIGNKKIFRKFVFSRFVKNWFFFLNLCPAWDSSEANLLSMMLTFGYKLPPELTNFNLKSTYTVKHDLIIRDKKTFCLQNDFVSDEYLVFKMQ